MPEKGRGLPRMRQMLGEEHTEKAVTNLTKFDPGYADFVVDSLFGDVWARPVLEPKHRSLVTIAALVAMGKTTEMATHMRAGMRNGLTADEIKEIVVHLAMYIGIPAASEARRVYEDVMKGA